MVYFFCVCLSGCSLYLGWGHTRNRTVTVLLHSEGSARAHGLSLAGPHGPCFGIFWSSLPPFPFSLIFLGFSMMCLQMDLLLFILLGIPVFSQIWSFLSYSLSPLIIANLLFWNLTQTPVRPSPHHPSLPCFPSPHASLSVLESLPLICTHFPFHPCSDHLCLISDPTSLKFQW